VGALLGADYYWRQYGAQNFLFFCDVGNVIIALATLVRKARCCFPGRRSACWSSRVFSRSIWSSGLDRRHWIGGTEFMFDPHFAVARQGR